MTVERDVSPATEEGRDMLNDLEVLWGKQAWASFPWGSTILAIEQEAAALERRRTVEQIRELAGEHDETHTIDYDRYCMNCPDVSAILDALASESDR